MPANGAQHALECGELGVDSHALFANLRDASANRPARSCALVFQFIRSVASRM
jgi:hypothetical protein